MQVQIAGRKIDVGAALQERIAAGLEDRISKYFQRTGEAVVAVSKPGWAFHVDCSIHLPSGVDLQAHGEADDAYAAFEVALDKIEKRVRRYKRRLRDHHRPKVALPVEPASERVIQASFQEDMGEDQDGDETLNGFDHGDAPIIVAESDMRLRTMSVSTAVMQLELGDSPALMFRNASHGALNMVYRRPDGNIGWVDPGQDA